MAKLEMLEAVSRRAPGIGIATVYRTLKLLVKEEVLKLVELPGESPHYEKTAQPHHHHFFCTACNRVFSIYSVSRLGCP
jgi:Fur family transcriptional regulator, ferric uptake regulator